MPNQPRTNSKQTVKFYDEQTIGDWALNYEYESINGSKPSAVNVRGTKANGGQLYINATPQNINVTFGGNAAMDANLLVEIQLEIADIDATFETPTPAANDNAN